MGFGVISCHGLAGPPRPLPRLVLHTCMGIAAAAHPPASRIFYMIAKTQVFIKVVREETKNDTVPYRTVQHGTVRECAGVYVRTEEQRDDTVRYGTVPVR